MRQLVRVGGVVILSVTLGAALAAVRRWLSERAPRRSVDRPGPVIGSFDTWPEVPRAPVAAQGPAGR